MAVTNLNLALSIIGIFAATSLAYFIKAGYQHRSHINRLHKQGFVSFHLLLIDSKIVLLGAVDAHIYLP